MALSTTTTARVSAVPAGAVEAGRVVTLPCGFEGTVTARELGPLAGEVSLYFGGERIILPSQDSIIMGW